MRQDLVGTLAAANSIWRVAEPANVGGHRTRQPWGIHERRPTGACQFA
jgi:hypothetical protein